MNDIKLAKEKLERMSKTCKDCKYMINNPDGGYCYMFEEKPPMMLPCGQFKEPK